MAEAEKTTALQGDTVSPAEEITPSVKQDVSPSEPVEAMVSDTLEKAPIEEVRAVDETPPAEEAPSATGDLDFEKSIRDDGNLSSESSLGDLKSAAHPSSRELSAGGSTDELTGADDPPAAVGFEDGGLPRWRFICLSISLGLGLFLSFLDGSIVATALYTIGVEFDALTKVTWVALAYSLANLGMAVVFATMADFIGRSNAYLVAQVTFFAFSLACGFAKSLDQLIAFRVLQGVGGSGLYALAMVIWPEMSSAALKKWIGAFVGLVVAASGVAGPILGGVITDRTTWRWVFWINPPVVLVSGALFVVAWPRGAGVGVGHHEKSALRRFDVKGCVYLLAGCVLPVFAFQEAGARQGLWGKGLFLGPLVAGVVSWFLLVGWELYITRRLPGRFNPIFPPWLLRNRRYAATTATTLLGGFGYYVIVYNVPLRFQTVNGKSPLAAGVSLLPMLCSSALGSFLSGGMSAKRDLLSHTITAGALLMTVGAGLLSTLSATPHVETKVYGFQVLVGLGFGLTVSSASILANVECELRDHATAQGLVAQARVFGGSLGLAAGTAILGHKVQTRLAGVVPADQLHSLFSAAKSLSPAQLTAVRSTYSDAFDETLRVVAIVSAISVLTAAASWDVSKVPLTERVKLQGQREAARINALREKERSSNESRVSLETGVLTPAAPAYLGKEVV